MRKEISKSKMMAVMYLLREQAAIKLLQDRQNAASKSAFEFACNMVTIYEKDSTYNEAQTAYNQRYVIHK